MYVEMKFLAKVEGLDDADMIMQGISEDNQIMCIDAVELDQQDVQPSVKSFLDNVTVTG
jgi:hypothetical protein